MEENMNVDQVVLAEDLSNKINYEFIDSFLVKPLDPIKVTKEFSKPVEKSKAQKDSNDISAVDYDEVTTEVKEVDSDFRKGIVLKVPYSYGVAFNENQEFTNMKHIHVGDTVLFRERSAAYFDLLKDSRMIRYYDIVAVVK